MPAPRVFDRDVIARHLQRRTGTETDFVMALVLEDLADRLAAVTRQFKRALIMAPDAASLPQIGMSGEGDFAFERASTILQRPGIVLIDPEAAEFPHDDYDLIVSLFDLQVINDVPGFLARVRAHLAPDGLFTSAALGGASLTELRQAFLSADAQLSGGAFGRVAPFIPLRDGGGLLQRAGFALPVADVETHKVRYGSPLALMSELKALGASNPLADRPHKLATRTLLATASEIYADMAGDADGKVRATLEIIWLSGWAPHESQQKPLARGSAKVSMTSILGKSGT